MKKSELKKIDRFLKTLEEIRHYFVSKSETPKEPEDMHYSLLAVQGIIGDLEEMREPKLEKEKPKLLAIPPR